MATIVAGGALSHSPLMNLDVPEGERESVAAFRDAARALGERIRAARPDVVVVCAQDHFRSVYYNNMPAFLIGTGDVTRLGDWHGPAGPLPVHPELARYLARGLFARGFEPSLSYDLKVDHGTAQVLELLGLEDVPVIPVLVNAAAPPLPTPARCYDFGRALGAAVESYPGALRVAVVGSGGLSHAPLKVAIETEQDPVQREFFIHGRQAPGMNDEVRIGRILGRIDDLAAAIRPEWDRMVLARFAAGEAAALAMELDADAIEAGGGSGGQELRSWLAMLGALQGAAVSVLHYAPVRFLVTGMAAIAADCAAGSTH